MAALKPHQDAKTGCWHQVIDHPESYDEYSCTCMIGFAMQRGIRRGWLAKDEYQPCVDRAWRAIKERTSADGKLVNVCTGTGKQKTLQDYFDRPAINGRDDRGGAMGLMFAAELLAAEKSRQVTPGRPRAIGNRRSPMRQWRLVLIPLLAGLSTAWLPGRRLAPLARPGARRPLAGSLRLCRRQVARREAGLGGQRSARAARRRSSPTGVVYFLGWCDDQDHLQAVDLKTGKKLWTSSYESPQYGRHATGDEGLYRGPSSTPEFDPATGIALHAQPRRRAAGCWNTREQGKLLWRLNLYDEYQMPQRPRIGRSGHRDYGYTTRRWCTATGSSSKPAARQGTLVAFDKRTGKEAWTSASKRLAGHTGGLVPMTVAGKPCVAVLTLTHLLVVRLDEGHAGETVAEYEWTTDFANNIATPAASGDKLLITSGYNHDAICCLKISLAGATKLWEQPLLLADLLAGHRRRQDLFRTRRSCAAWTWKRVSSSGKAAASATPARASRLPTGGSSSGAAAASWRWSPARASRPPTIASWPV